jgi:hypothetical protein
MVELEPLKRISVFIALLDDEGHALRARPMDCRTS